MSSPAETVLIAAQSGRSLAQAARAAGFLPLVADCFADGDTCAAGEVALVAHGLHRASLISALDRLAAGKTPIGLVCGSGFEDRSVLLATLQRRHILLGNDAETVRRLKDPVAFARLCRDLGIPHPEISLAPQSGAWLSKRRGGAGGWHVHEAAPGRSPARGHYLQKAVAGAPVSLLFLAASGRALVLDSSRQWADRAPRRPFRYGGAARPAGIAPEIAAAMAGAVHCMARTVPLIGLNSADFLLQENGSFHLLEINPRLGATLDLYPDERGRLFHMHVDACRGTVPDAAPEFANASAAAIVYAPRALTIGAAPRWPDWAADRSAAGTRIPRGAPLCTVLAAAASPEAAERLVRKRAGAIIGLVGEPK